MEPIDEENDYQEPEDKDDSEPAAGLSDEELKTARSLRTKIMKYKEAFPNDLKDIDFAGVVDSEDLDFLEEKYNSVRLARANASNGPGIVGVTYTTALVAIENMAKFTNGVLLLDGLSANAANNKEIRDCLAEINIEYCDWSDLTTPERRLFVSTIYTIYLTHAANKARANNPVETMASSIPGQPTQTWNPPTSNRAETNITAGINYSDL
jgi:hypothetical protein